MEPDYLQQLNPSEPLDELRVEDLKTQLHELTSLLNSPGWDLYRNVLKGQIESRKNNVFFTPAVSGDDTLQAEYQKGEGSGIYLSLNMLELLVEAHQEELSRRNIEENEEDT